MTRLCFNCFRNIPDEGDCPYCGYNPEKEKEKYPLAIRPGTTVGNRYLLGRVLGQGGFGISYVAYDKQTRSRVAIKEYLPAEIATRNKTNNSIMLFSGDRMEEYEFGRRQFLEEARTLAAFVGNEHIIKILSFFEENGTAYFAMEYIEGETLKQKLEKSQKPLTVQEANQYLLPIMEALDWVHSKGIVHRDISPDNIMIRTDETAKLIDFGAARISTGEKSKSLDVILKHGFAPKEQYSRRGRQGPFTDVYAMAATYYYAITGKIPPDAIDRSQEDNLIPPGVLGVKIRGDTEAVLLKALAVSSTDRYQTMADFYNDMMRTMPHPFALEATQGTKQEEREWTQTRKTQAAELKKTQKTSVKNVQRQRAGGKKWILAVVACMILAAGAGAWFFLRSKGDIVAEDPSPEIQPPAEQTTEIVPVETPIEEERPEDQQQEASEEAEETPAVEEIPVGDYRLVGSIVTFGKYYRSSGVKDDIEWVILAVNENESLLLSRYAIDARPYNENYGMTWWPQCDLQYWLNNDFMKAAFSKEEEQPRILRQHNPNDESQGNPSWPGTGTVEVSKEYIFLLSYAEVEEYLTDSDYLKCTPTSYARSRGADQYSGSGKNQGNCWWWLRSPGSTNFNAACVRYDGSVIDFRAETKQGGIRPCIWINTEGL